LANYYYGAQVLSGAGYTCDCLGVDISPLAVKLAARKYEGVRFAVANSFHLPFRDASFDCLVTAFSPWPVSEFRRVLRPGGFVVAAGPGEEHLLGLKVGSVEKKKTTQPKYIEQY
jgi:23S rRNA (guanine745-N1)-methyltransferase